jgi:hypothetical protein
LNNFTEFLKSEYDPDLLEDIARYGADTGYSGITYDDDLRDIYNNYEVEIWETLEAEGEEKGMSVLHYLEVSYSRRSRNFNKQLRINDPTIFIREAVWSAIEICAAEIVCSWKRACS